MRVGGGGERDPDEAPALRGVAAMLQRGSSLLLPLLTALAAFPVSGWRLAAGWLLAMDGGTGAHQRARAASFAGVVFSWGRDAGYSAGAFFLVALHTGA